VERAGSKGTQLKGNRYTLGHPAVDTPEDAVAPPRARLESLEQLSPQAVVCVGDDLRYARFAAVTRNKLNVRGM